MWTTGQPGRNDKRGGVRNSGAMSTIQMENGMTSQGREWIVEGGGVRAATEKMVNDGGGRCH